MFHIGRYGTKKDITVEFTGTLVAERKACPCTTICYELYEFYIKVNMNLSLFFNVMKYS